MRCPSWHPRPKLLRMIEHDAGYVTWRMCSLSLRMDYVYWWLVAASFQSRGSRGEIPRTQKYSPPDHARNMVSVYVKHHVYLNSRIALSKKKKKFPPVLFRYKVMRAFKLNQTFYFWVDYCCPCALRESWPYFLFCCCWWVVANSKHWFTTSCLQTPSTGLRHLSFGGRCRKAMLGVWGCGWVLMKWELFSSDIVGLFVCFAFLVANAWWFHSRLIVSYLFHRYISLTIIYRYITLKII